MKKSVLLLSYLLFICCICYSQAHKKTPITESDKMNTMILSVLKDKSFKDSVALYTFAVKVTVKKTKEKTIIKEIKANDSLFYKAFPKLDSLFGGIDFGVFINGYGTREIIMPFAIVIPDYNGNTKYTIEIKNILPSYDKLFFYNIEKFRPDVIYLPTFAIDANKRVYW